MQASPSSPSREDVCIAPAISVGVISDTHGLLRPEAIEALSGMDRLIHAGDVGSDRVLVALRALAPLTVVRGNVDHGTWADALPETEALQVGSVWIYVLHDPGALGLDPKAAGFSAVLCGHTHEPLVEDRNGVLHMNPGSAGPRRFRLPVTVGRLRIRGSTVEGEIIPLL